MRCQRSCSNGARGIENFKRDCHYFGKRDWNEKQTQSYLLGWFRRGVLNIRMQKGVKNRMMRGREEVKSFLAPTCTRRRCEANKKKEHRGG